ncbi:zinc-binding alcohol dehydrogenase family protein [Fusobacterium sp. PH5-44]|uniref:zinc-binding alcohol dehydrogenase family protein n=1 Tax=unclassified Fusobacterium TaxID=2648384 RepID=UPI003D1BC107
MKVIRVINPNNLMIEEEPIPVIKNDDEVLIKVKTAGICGSDISIYKGTSPVATYPRVIGHEFAGEVIEIGKNVTHVSVGDHVTVNPVNNCGICPICKKGRSNVCANLKVTGVHIDGGYREYVSVPEKNVFKLSKDIPWDIAAIIEPYTVAAQVVNRGGIEKGDTVLIYGSGQIALTILQVCNIIGAKCILTDIVDDRLTKAKEFGATYTINTKKENTVEKVLELTDGIGADVSIDAACVGISLKEATLATRSAGVVVTMGFHDSIAQITEFSITSRELDIRGTRLNNNRFPQVIEWVESKQLDPSKIITHHFKFTDIEKAFEQLKNDPENTMKIILEF